MSAQPALAPQYVALERLLGWYGAEMRSLPERRAAQSAFVAQLKLPARHDVATREQLRAEREGWWEFEPDDARPRRAIFYVHGGGLAFYSLADYASLLQYFAATTRTSVSGFCYPTAPEHDAQEILTSLALSFKHRLATLAPDCGVVVVADSIGAYLTLCLAARHFRRRFRRIVMIYPVLDLQGCRPSYTLHGARPFLPAQSIDWFRRLLRSTREPRQGAVFDPFRIGTRELRELSPVTLVSAEFDVLRDEAFAWVAYMREHGLQAEHKHYTELPHDFCLHAGRVPAAQQAVIEIGNLLST